MRKDSYISESWVNVPKPEELMMRSQEFVKLERIPQDSNNQGIKEVQLPTDLFTTTLNPSFIRGETYYEKFKNIGMNLKYNFESLGQYEWLLDGGRDKKSIIYLLGEKYEIEPDNKDKARKLEEIKAKFAKIVWFSYRTNFPKLNYKKIPATEWHICDTGWGCMLRACQMMFAECLKRCYRTQQIRAIQEGNQEESNFPEIEEKELNKKIISWFLDCEIAPNLAPYSIQTLSNYIYEKFDTLPGVWLKPSQVLYSIQYLHKKYGKNTLPDLETEIYLEGTIFISEAMKKMASMRSLDDEKSIGNNESAAESDFEVIDEEEMQKCSVQKIIKKSPKLKASDLKKSSGGDRLGPGLESQLSDSSSNAEKVLRMKWKKSLVVYVLAKIGLEKPNPECIPFIKEMLEYPESVGMIGGKPGLAYYIVGYTGNKLIYLDPHFVQEAIKSKEELNEKLSTYSCEKIRYVDFTEIDTSVAFGFYIQNETSFYEFIRRFHESSEKKESFLGLEMSIMKENSGDFESVGDEEELDMIFE